MGHEYNKINKIEENLDLCFKEASITNYALSSKSFLNFSEVKREVSILKLRNHKIP